jgi:hypothetical protein
MKMPRKTSSSRRASPKSKAYEAELKHDIQAEGRKIGEMASKVYTKNSTKGIPFAGSKTAAALAQAFEEPVAYNAEDLEEELQNDTGDCINKLSLYSVEPELFNLGRCGNYEGSSTGNKVNGGTALHLDERAAVMASVGASQVLCDILHGVRSKNITLQDGLDKKLIYIEDLIEHIHDRYGSVITLEKDTTSVLDRVSRDHRMNLERHLVKQLFENVGETIVEDGGKKFAVTSANDFYFQKFKNMLKVREKSVGKTWKSIESYSDYDLQVAYNALRDAVKAFIAGSPRVMFSSNLKISVSRPKIDRADRLAQWVADGPVLLTSTGMVYTPVKGITGNVNKFYGNNGEYKAVDVDAGAPRSLDTATEDVKLEMVSHILGIVAAHVLTYANTASVDFLVQLGQKASTANTADFAPIDAEFQAELDNVFPAGAAAKKINAVASGGGAKAVCVEVEAVRAAMDDNAVIAAGAGNRELTPTFLHRAITNTARVGAVLTTPARKVAHGIIMSKLFKLYASNSNDIKAAVATGTLTFTREELILVYAATKDFLVPHTVFAPGLLAALELYKVSEGRFDDEMALQLNTNKEVKELFKAAHTSYDMDDESSGAKSYVRATDTTPAWLMSAEDKLKYEQQFEKIKEYSGKRVDTAVNPITPAQSAKQLAEAFTNYRDTQGVAKRLGAITGFGRRRRRSGKKASFGRRKRTSHKKASFGRRKRKSASRRRR